MWLKYFVSYVWQLYLKYFNLNVKNLEQQRTSYPNPVFLNLFESVASLEASRCLMAPLTTRQPWLIRICHLNLIAYHCVWPPVEKYWETYHDKTSNLRDHLLFKHDIDDATERTKPSIWWFDAWIRSLWRLIIFADEQLAIYWMKSIWKAKKNCWWPLLIIHGNWKTCKRIKKHNGITYRKLKQDCVILWRSTCTSDISNRLTALRKPVIAVLIKNKSTCRRNTFHQQSFGIISPHAEWQDYSTWRTRGQWWTAAEKQLKTDDYWINKLFRNIYRIWKTGVVYCTVVKREFEHFLKEAIIGPMNDPLA